MPDRELPKRTDLPPGPPPAIGTSLWARRPRWPRRGAAWLGLAAVVAAWALDPAPLGWLRNAFFDLEQRLIPAPAPRAPVTLVEIDEASIAALGQWPWPRDLVAELLDAVARQRPAAIGLDILFAEPDRLSISALAERLPLDPATRDVLAALPSNDLRLAESLGRAPTVLAAAVALEGGGGASGNPTRAPVILRLATDRRVALTRYDALLASLPILERAAAGVGLVSLEREADGVIRRIPTVVLVGDAVLPSFPIEVLRLAWGARAVTLDFDGSGLAAVAIGARPIATDPSGHVWLRPSGPGQVPRLSAADVLAGRADAAGLSGRIVLIGTSAAGIGERFLVPGGRTLSALEVQAQAVENLYARSYLLRPRLAAFAEAALAVFACLAVLALRPRRRGYAGQAAVLLLVIALGATGLAVFGGLGVLLDPSLAIIAALTAYLLLLGAGVVEAQRARRRSERERAMALTLAEAANRSKTDFLAHMSHELRTPLNAILGFSEMMKSGMLGPISPPKYREYAEDIHAMGTHLLGLVSQVLDMAKVESGKAELAESEFDSAAAVRECLRTVREAFGSAGARMVLDEGTSLPRLWADRGMFTQMLMNLLSNAIRHTPAGGTVRVQGARAESGGFRLSVSDTGIGMAARDVARAFEGFRSGNSAMAANFEGIGLGLPLTKAMIELHGGHIEVASAAGEGTVATLVFPAERVQSTP